MKKIPVFYRPEQSCDQANSYSPSAGKPALVMQDWLKHPRIGPFMQVEHFAPAGNELLYLAHDADYVDAVMSGKEDNGFGNRNLAIAESLRYTVGSLVGACKHVLSRAMETNPRIAVSPTSGFHHACHDSGGGFCTFNGLMIAAMKVHQLGLAKRILIIDMDQHRGNGTEDIIKQLGIDYVDHITAGRSYKTAKEALRACDFGPLLHESRRKGTPYDLVIYQAGADIHVDDPLGGLLTTREMLQRDRDVFHSCIDTYTPLVWNLAGGYQTSPDGGIEPVLALHRQTMIACCRAYNVDVKRTLWHLDGQDGI